MEKEPDRQSRFLTLAIHTYHCANLLKATLEAEGIEVMLQNVDLNQPCSAAGVRVRIRERDLPFALRIVENPEVFRGAASQHTDNVVLVPVDFTPLSERAAEAAFRIASQRNAKIHLLNAYSDPFRLNTIQLSDSLTYDIDSSVQEADLKEMSRRSMENFCASLRKRVKQGLLPPVAFTAESLEGLPEDVIMQWSKQHAPSLIVMATRGADTKERELIGSVTAEVLDTVRYPIFTVPPASPSGESSACDTTADYRRVMMFVTFEQDDFLTLDALHRFLPHSENLEITFVKIGKRAPLYNAHTYHNLLNYAEKHYPECHFSVSEQTVASLMEGFGGDSSKHNPDLIVVPNKKKNAFARLFNPGIAHRILFNADIPMMVVPV